MCHINTGQEQIRRNLIIFEANSLKLNHIFSSELNHIWCSELNHICSSVLNHICISVSMRWSPAARQNLPDEYFISSHCCLCKYGEDEEKIFHLFVNILSLCKYFISSHGCLRKYGEDEEKIFYLFANILSLLTVVFVNMGRTRRKARNQGLEISS